MLLTILKRDLNLALKKGSGALYQLLFFIIVVSMFVFAIGANKDFLSSFGGAIIIVSALLSSLLTLPRMFESDYEDGSLELLMLNIPFKEKYILIKIISHWLISGLPLVLVTPLLFTFTGLSFDLFLPIIVAVILASLLFSTIGVMIAGVILGSRRAAGLAGLLLLPLLIPVVIFSVEVAKGNFDFPFIFLSAMLLFMLPISIVFGALSVKLSA